ncbi:MAG: hypothetical protein U0002_09350 [Thermoanaerobaculia bacterium]
MSAATPAAESRWPKLPLIEPMAQKGSSAPVPAKTRFRAAISITSPIGVAVPWHSIAVIDSGGTAAIARASATTSAWPSIDGAE